MKKILKIINPEYVYLKLISNYSIRNANTNKLAKAISSLHRGMPQNIKREEAKLINLLGREVLLGTKYSFTTPAKVAYYIYIEKQVADFYLIIPSQYLSVIKEKITDTWPSVTVEKVNELPMFSDTAAKYQMAYRQEDALSLRVDRRDNDLLNSCLNIVDVLEPGDRVGIFYNFMPISQFSWASSYRETIQRVKYNKPVDRNKMGPGYILKAVIAEASDLTKSIGLVAGGDTGNSSERDANLIESALTRVNRESRISEATHSKGHSPVISSQILVFSESGDRLRQMNNARSLVQTFDAITEDNSLVGKRYYKSFDPLKFNLPGAEINKVSAEECSNFLALPGRELLEQYKFISRVETQEIPIPEELRTGTMCLGESRHRGESQLAYLSDDPEYKYLTLVLIGPTRAGKTTLIGNLSRDAIKAGECVIMFDFIKNCELSGEVAALFPPAKVLYIECSDPNKLQGLGYNEVRSNSDTFLQYSNAKLKTTQLLTLINSINSDASPLTPKMERFLSSAALIAFISGGSVRDVFRVLLDHHVRHNFISRVPETQHENLEEYAESLVELDDHDEKTGKLVGSKANLIIGVIDRLQKLKSNPYMEMMLKKGTEGNIDLVAEMQKNQLICIKMPETMFATDGERDIYCTYWMTKIWLALQIRGQVVPDRAKHTKVNLVIDELYQVHNTETLLKDKLSRLAKFSLKPIISCHYLNQIKIIRDELRSANTSFMLISGCDKENYKELKSELYPFTEDDLTHLPRYHSMNYIKSKEGYAKFITKLPKPV